MGWPNDLRKGRRELHQERWQGPRPAFNKADAIAVMLEKYEVCCGMFHDFDWSPWNTGGAQGKLTIIPAAQNHILGPGKREGPLRPSSDGTVEGLYSVGARRRGNPDQGRRELLPDREGRNPETGARATAFKMPN